MKLANWGNYPRIDTNFRTFRNELGAQDILREADSLVARGLGRCYGDSALNASNVASTLAYDNILEFSQSDGRLVCQAGLSLATILDVFLPRGWFLPVTPGTKFVTVGGALASDVHGKNHHCKGSFSQHTDWIDVLTAGGEVVRCSETEHPDLFLATCGGMGLTGIILRACIRLAPVPSAFIRQETVKARNLEEIMAAFDESGHWTYSVAWIDCLQRGAMRGRSILMRGEHLEAAAVPAKFLAAPTTPPAKRRLTIPFSFPNVTLNNLSIKAFNALYYGKAPKGTDTSTVDCNTFFYPLDGILHWNRIYGSRGFTQYQFVLPRESGKAGLEAILGRIADSGQGSFLAVLKLFGPGNDRPLSFPMEGYTLALDFPITKRLFPLLKELDAMVVDHGGRLYLTKDVRMDADVFEAGYGKNADVFREAKAAWDPDARFTSLQSRRLNIGG